MNGRKKPYTDRGIRRLKCIRCPNKASTQWQICADGNLYRPICQDCDLDLNAMVLEWANIPNGLAKMARYVISKRKKT